MEDRLQNLEQLLGYSFKESQLLITALTHCSKSSEHNERLEFLGDGVVNLIVAELLYHRFKDAAEGELSRFRSALVNRAALANLAKQFNLDHYILLGPGELHNGGNKRESILSCTMEAIIAAIFLDGGFAAVHRCLSNWHEPLLISLSRAAYHKDSKTLLQEYLQRCHLALPLYLIEKIEGKAHQQQFIVSCEVTDIGEKTLGKGTSRRRAEQEAAYAMLNQLTENKT